MCTVVALQLYWTNEEQFEVICKDNSLQWFMPKLCQVKVRKRLRDSLTMGLKKPQYMGQDEKHDRHK